MVSKYSREERGRNQRQYLESRTGDLTSYAAATGDAFASRINLLAQLIRDSHHPSLGLYKERLLMKVILEHIPSLAKRRTIRGRVARADRENTRPPEMSNGGCLPGRAGGPPAVASRRLRRPRSTRTDW